MDFSLPPAAEAYQANGEERSNDVEDTQYEEAAEYDTHCPSSPIIGPGEKTSQSDSGIIHTFRFTDDYISNVVENCSCATCHCITVRRDIIMAEGDTLGLDISSSDIPGTDTGDNEIQVRFRVGTFL